MIRWVRRWASEQRPTFLLGLVRVAFGCLLLKDGMRGALSLRDNGYFADAFFIPVLPPSWVPDELGYSLLLGLKIAGAACAIAGVVPRAGLLLAAAIGLYVLACDRLQYHNNRYALHLLALLLAFAPCDRSFRLSLFRGPAHMSEAERPAPFWAVRLVQLQMALIYGASGVGKLLDPDWNSGVVMMLRFTRAAEFIATRQLPIPGILVQVLHSPLFASAASKAAIATELFLTIGLLLPATRVAALWLGVLFHLGIQASANIDMFSYLMLSGYVLYATPELHERTLLIQPSRRMGRFAAGCVRWLDWLCRFRLATSANDGPALTIVDRDGEILRGFSAFVGMARALPLLFPLWLPLAVADFALRSQRRGGRAAPGRTPLTDRGHV